MHWIESILKVMSTFWSSSTLRLSRRLTKKGLHRRVTARHCIQEINKEIPIDLLVYTRAEYLLHQGVSFLNEIEKSGKPYMKNEFTAIIEQDEDWYIALCPEIPEANGQGATKDEARESLAKAIAILLEDRREEGLRVAGPGAIRERVTIS